MMKKYIKPTAEISVFDIEDITMSTYDMSNPTQYAAKVETAKTDLAASGYVVVEW